MKQKNLFLLVGPPASGKSTFLAKMMPMLENARCISRDDIRFALVAEDEPYFCREDEVFDCFIDEIRKAIKDYDNIFVDATHISYGSRKKTLRRLNLNDKVNVIPLVFTTPLEVCIERNSYRVGRRQVPESAIQNMFKSLTDPFYDKEDIKKYYTEIRYINDWGEYQWVRPMKKGSEFE